MRFHGEHLAIDDLQDVLLANWFPEVDRHSQYREIDSWLDANPRRRPRNMKRFLHTWFAKQKRKESFAEYIETDGTRCRITAADRRTGRV